MLENYILLEPNVSCEYIIKTNLMEKLVLNCHNPKIHGIILNLIDPYASKYNIFGETQVKLWEWCYENNFFYKLISLIQNEKMEKLLEEESGTTEEILQTSKKYYSGEKNQMIMKAMVKKFGMFQNLIENNKPTENQTTNNLVASLNNTNDKTLDQILGPISLKNVENEYIKLEEFEGSMPDIDNFKGFLSSKNKTKPLNPQIKEKDNKLYIPTLSKSVAFLQNESMSVSSTTTKREQVNKKNNSQHQNTSEIPPENKSTIDSQMGFTISKVKRIYPNRLCKELITPLDKISQKPEYKWQAIVEDEKIALPAAVLAYQILSSVIENEENQATREFLKRTKCVGGLSVVDMLFNNSAICLEKIFIVNFIQIPQI